MTRSSPLVPSALLAGLVWMTGSAVPHADALNAVLLSIETLDYPGATATYAYAINDAGVVAGTAKGPGGSVGFVRFRDGSFSLPIVDPNDTEHLTSAYGINNRQTIVGDSLALEGNTFRVHGFLLRRERFTTYDHPDVPYTTLTGTNNKGDVAGMTNDGSNHFRGFTDVNGTVTDFEPPGALVEVGAMNDRGQVVGTFLDLTGVRGFFRSASGRLTPIDAPGGDFTTARGINNAGVVAGFFADLSDPTRGHGFVLKGGVFTTLDVPGAMATNILGINDALQVVGYYTLPGEPSRVHGFVARMR